MALKPLGWKIITIAILCYLFLVAILYTYLQTLTEENNIIESLYPHDLHDTEDTPRKMAEKRQSSNEISLDLTDMNSTSVLNNSVNHQTFQGVVGDCTNQYFSTEFDSPAIWFVDLKIQYEIKRVTMKIPATFQTIEMNQMSLILTNTIPNTKQPNTNKDVCGFWVPSKPKTGAQPMETVEIFCNRKGRYLVLANPMHNKMLKFCNLKVFGEKGSAPNWRDPRICYNDLECDVGFFCDDSGTCIKRICHFWGDCIEYLGTHCVKGACVRCGYMTCMGPEDGFMF